ncbi:MAG TPA: MASE4 domain-containing protein [Stellaceae bacterium]|nr:MASE4 domain-containing protein [Stellaceae bacterium]
MNDRSASQGSDAFLVTASAPLGARRRALAVAIGLLVPFCALLPFARVPLPRIEAFIPISESILALTGLVTAAFLLVVFRRSRLRAVLCLASGYLFISLMTLPLMLAAPGVLLSSDPFGADPQTGAWLDTFRQAGFPVFVSCYALLRRYEVASRRLHKGAPADFIWAATGAVAAVCLLTLFAAAGRQLLPPIMLGDGYPQPPWWPHTYRFSCFVLLLWRS